MIIGWGYLRTVDIQSISREIFKVFVVYNKSVILVLNFNHLPIPIVNCLQCAFQLIELLQAIALLNFYILVCLIAIVVFGFNSALLLLVLTFGNELAVRVLTQHFIVERVVLSKIHALRFYQLLLPDSFFYQLKSVFHSVSHWPFKDLGG